MNKDSSNSARAGTGLPVHRISLDSIVYAFRRGASPESIQRSFPLLMLEQVYGAITFYLAQKPEIDAYLARGAEELERIRASARDADPEFHKILETARSQLPTRQPEDSFPSRRRPR